MTKRNLATALTAALANSPDPGKLPDGTPKIHDLPGDDALLAALRNSATGRDQIMQRRIGMLFDEPIS